MSEKSPVTRSEVCLCRHMKYQQGCYGLPVAPEYADHAEESFPGIGVYFKCCRGSI